MSCNETPLSTRRDLIKAAALIGTATTAAPASQALAQTQDAPGKQLNSNFRLYDPDKLPPSTGFSQVAEVTRGKLLYIAGQVPRNVRVT